jgi:endonuclease/exonuclease/phosphatase family metal-dependent hydrolase
VRRFLWTVFVVLDAALLLCFSAGYAARYLHPRHLWWVQLIAVALPYLTVMLIGFTFIVAGTRRWGLFGGHLFLLVLALVRFMPSMSGAAVGTTDTLTLMTFNLGYPDNANAPLLAQLARQEDPHIISFQESYVGLDSTRRHVGHIPEYLRLLVDSLGYSVVPPSSADTSMLRESIFSRGLILDSGQKQLPRGSHSRYQTSYSYARFAWQGREGVLYNVHLRTYGRRTPWGGDSDGGLSPRFWMSFWHQYRAATLDRAREAEEIRARIDQERLPVLVSGDFNSTPHTWDYYHLARGLQDAFRTGGVGWGGTYHRRFPFVRIDHLLVSPAFKVLSAHVADAPLSDHRPLVVQICWRESIINSR